MSEKQYRLNKWGTKLLKNNRPLLDWANESDDIVDLLNEQYNEIQRCKLAYNQLTSYVDANFDEYMTQKKLNEQIKELESCNHSLAQKEIRKLTKIIELEKELNKKNERIKELEKENEKIRQEIKEETDRVIKLEQYVYTKLCPQSEHYDEKVLSAIINTILSDVK